MESQLPRLAAPHVDAAGQHGDRRAVVLPARRRAVMEQRRAVVQLGGSRIVEANLGPSPAFSIFLLDRGHSLIAGDWTCFREHKERIFFSIDTSSSASGTAHS